MKTDEQTIKQMMMDGKSDIQIAKAVHVGRTRLAHLRRQFGIDCFKKLFVASLDELKEVVQNVNSGMSTLTKEASLRGVSRVTLARAIKKAGLSVREYRHKNPEGIDGYELTDRQWQILVGDMLGDGCLVRTSENHAYYQCTQSEKQREFVDWKYNEFLPLSSRKSGYATKEGRYARMGTFTCEALGMLHKDFYPNGSGYKCIPVSCVKKLSPLGLAVWYMGDGSLNRNTGVITIGKQIGNVAEVNDILNEKFHCNSVVKEYGNCYQIRFLNQKRFFSLVAPFLLESFGYKIPVSYSANKDNQQPSLEENLLEGSSTRESLNPAKGMAVTPAGSASFHKMQNGTSGTLSR